MTRDLPSYGRGLGSGFSGAKPIEISDDEIKALKVESNGAVICHEVVTKEEFFKRPYMVSGSLYYLTPPAKDLNLLPFCFVPKKVRM